MSISFISSFEFDNVKNVKDIKGKAGYNDIEIKNTFGLGKTLWSGSLETNTNNCGIDCSATQTIILGEEGSLIDEVIFKTLQEDGSWIKQSIRSYQLYIKINEEEYDVDDYEYQCVNGKLVVNDSGSNYKQVCNNVKVGTHKEKKPLWEQYILGTELPKGTYEVKLEGKKKPSRTVDWIYKTQGETLDEWASWTPSLNVDIAYYYSFDETTGTNAEEEVYGINNITLNKISDVNWETGKIGNSIRFNGTASGGNTIGNAVLSANFSINVWTKLNTAGIQPGVIEYGVFSSDGFNWYEAADPTLTFESVSVATGSTKPIDTWVMRTMTYDNSTRNMSVYQNGTIVATGTGASTFNLADAIMVIGNTTNPVNGVRNGSIDELGMWNKTLTASEVSQLWNSGDGITYTDIFNVILNTPLDNAIDSSPIDFNCTANSYDGATITNISLWHNDSGVFKQEKINLTITGATNTTIFTDTLLNSIKWTCQACDSDGECFFATENRTLTLDNINPDVNVTYPVGAIDYGYVGANQTFNWTVSDTNLDSCWYDYNGTNITTTCLDNSSSFLLEQGNYNLTMYANDSVNNANSSYREWTYAVFENSRSFNNYTYQTAAETFSINVTATNPTGTLYYNGTSHAGTRTGTGPYVFNSTFDIPATEDITNNNTFYWDIVSGATTATTSTSNQNVSAITFAQCNATYTQAYLNFTALDEADSSVIANVTIPLLSSSYWLGSGSQLKNFTFINNTGNQNYSFCFSPVDKNVSIDLSLQYEDEQSAYPQRTYEQTGTLSNASTDLTLYLLKSADGQYVTFQVINLAESPIEGVNMKATRVISGSTITVGEGDTDAAGAITFWLNPNFAHTISANGTGYDYYTTSLTPTQTSYTINLGSSSISVDDYTVGITTSINPTNSSLLNDTSYDFDFILSSSFWNVDEFGFVLKNESDIAVASNSVSTNGGTATVNYNIGNSTNYLTMDYYWVIAGNYTNGSKNWYVLNSAGTDWSIKIFFEDFQSYIDVGLFGSDNFGKSILIFLIIFTFTGIMSYKYGLISPVGVSTIAFGIVLFLDVGLNMMSDINAIGGVPHFPTIFMAIIMISILFREAIQ